jgi:hypothetical protein
MEIAHVEMDGSPYEMGVQHGQQVAALIRETVDHYGSYEAATPEVRAALRAIEATLEGRAHKLLEEMRGIAWGAGLAYEDILHLNAVYDARGDLLHSGRRCTAVGLPSTPDGPLVAKTDDVGLDERHFETWYRARPATGLPYLYYAFAGSVWNQGGINGAGLVVAMTGLRPAGERNLDGIPSLIFLRMVLAACATVEEALAFTWANPLRGYGCSMTMADPSVEAITVVENYPALAAVRRYTREPSVHTNLPLWPETQALPPDEGWLALYDRPGFEANTQARLDNAARLADEIPGTVDGLKQFLGNHAPTGAICQHGQTGLHTSVAMIMVPRQRAMIAAEGYGCEPYTGYVV